jgi:transcription elongation factor GreA
LEVLLDPRFSTFWSTDVSSTDDAVTFLTQEAYDRLSRELEELIANRPAMAAEINARREEGDLRENGGYHAAREEQGKQEGRILQLQQLLRSAKVGEAPVSEGVAGPGMIVEVRFEGDDEVETFLIGSREESETAGVAVYSAASPLGKALTGAGEGDTVEYETPTGKTMKVTLVSAKPFVG